MGAIDDFMKRRGWAKLDRYGLVLTPDDRVLSTRPAVLDDGLGGKIVGWAEGDLAAMELEKWTPAGTPAAAKPVAATRSPQPAAPAAPRPAPRGLPGVAPAPEMPAAPPVDASIAFAPTELARPAAPPPAPVRTTAPMAAVAAPAAPAPAPVAITPPPMFVAPAPAAAPEVAAREPEGEDEWEWEIAMARARAASEEIGAAAAAMGFSKPKAPAPQPKKTMQMPPVAAAAPKAPVAPQAPQAPRTLQMAAVAMGKPEPMPAWRKTEELPAQEWSDETAATSTRVMSPLEKQLAVGKRSTVIPVPELPVAARPSDVRPVPSPRTSSPRMRMARGTGREDTVLTRPAPEKHEDSTSPYVTLPPEVKPTGYAHTRRAAAKHR